jgi:prepilin-type processing-associated H-X9-DG protein
LLLPAIQAAREAARRTQCKNQLKQIGLAMQSHVDNFKVFPTGGAGPDVDIANYSSGGKPFGPDKQGLNWTYQILPFLEEGAIRNITTQAKLQGISVPLYTCPSRRSAQPLNALNGIAQTFFPVDYAGAQPCTAQCASGCAALAPFNPQDSVPFTSAGYTKNQPSFWGGKTGLGMVAGPTALDNQVYDGVIVRSAWQQGNGTFANTARPTSMAKITDGTSHTVVVGEKYVRTDLYEGGSKSDDKGWTDGWDPDAMRSTCFAPLQDSDSLGFQFPPLNAPGDFFGHDRDVYYFGSAHTGGLNAAFADGSVHTINYAVDVLVFNALGTRAGGEVVDNSTIN